MRDYPSKNYGNIQNRNGVWIIPTGDKEVESFAERYIELLLYIPGFEHRNAPIGGIIIYYIYDNHHYHSTKQLHVTAHFEVIEVVIESLHSGRVSKSKKDDWQSATTDVYHDSSYFQKIYSDVTYRKETKRIDVGLLADPGYGLVIYWHVSMVSQHEVPFMWPAKFETSQSGPIAAHPQRLGDSGFERKHPIM